MPPYPLQNNRNKGVNSVSDEVKKRRLQLTTNGETYEPFYQMRDLGGSPGLPVVKTRKCSVPLSLLSPTLNFKHIFITTAFTHFGGHKNHLHTQA